MNSLFLSGNEAIARGAWEGGVSFASGYPGTPSTEIMETLATYKDDIYCEWSPNEKVALEAAVGASLTGVRCVVTMKLVGLNVAADPLMTLSYIGCKGGLVICVADDPGMHSSQTEQDTRHYARLAKIPILEPANAQEGKDYMIRALEISEKYRCPVILRTTTAVSHSRSLVTPGERVTPPEACFEADPTHFVPVPIWGRKLRQEVEVRMVAQAEEATGDTALNQVFRRGNQLGIISSGLPARLCLELFPEASVLKLGWSWPFPDECIKSFAGSIEKLLVVEEGDPILEEHVKSLGFACEGKNIVPRTGELTPAKLMQLKAALDGQTSPVPAAVEQAADLPNRPPILCSGCPHRGIFFALKKFDVVVTGDIGCYTLGVFPPLNRTDVVLCMGGGFSMAHGMDKAGEKRPVVGIVGDSTFFHSGITGLLDLVYNRGKATLIVVDNRTTAMTGHQEHPGTGKTLMGQDTYPASIEKIAAACGMERIRIVNPYQLQEVIAVLQEELYCDAPSLIISRAPCLLKEKKPVGPALKIDQNQCRKCKQCLQLGCPAIELSNGMISINANGCAGCNLCNQVCKFGAIVPAEV